MVLPCAPMAPALAQNRFSIVTDLFGSLFWGFFALTMAVCAANPFPPSPNDPAPPTQHQDQLEHYVQWGLFDSLYMAASAAIAQYDLKSDSLNPRIDSGSHLSLATLYQLRGLACLSRQDSIQAKQDFIAAACLKSQMRLDSFYVPLPMIRFNDSLFQQVEVNPSLCQAFPQAMASAVSPSATLLDSSKEASLPISNSSSAPIPSPSEVHQNAGSAWLGWTLGGIAATGFIVTGFEHWEMTSAYERQSEAALAGEAAIYHTQGQAVQRHFLRRNVAFATSLIFAAGSAYAFYHNHHLKAQVTPEAVTVLWTF